MISNITNALPALVKRLKEHDKSIKPEFNLIDMLKFYESILPRSKSSAGLRHIFLDCKFIFKEEFEDVLTNFQITLDTLPFLKEFEYIIDKENRTIIIRSNMEELSIFSLIILGSLKNLPNDVNNKSIFISLAESYLKFCLKSSYNVCEREDIEILETYNKGWNEDFLDSVSFSPTSAMHIGTIHFIGIDLNKDILKIFEQYKNVRFTFNEENASFIISMHSSDWDDFWKDAPKYLKDEFSEEEAKIDVT